MHGILKLRQQIVAGPEEGWRDRYRAVGTEELVPLLEEGAAGA
jgi:hypothetical protein